MRARTLALLALAAALPLAGPAAAQEGAPDGHALAVAVEPFGEPLVPMAGMRVLNATVEVPCEAIGDAGVDVALNVTGADPETRVDLTPRALRFASCEGRISSVQTAQVIVRFEQGARAFWPDDFNVTATGPGLAPAAERVRATPGFFGVLDVRLPEAARTVEPGALLVFQVEVANLGNAEQRVTFEEVNVSGLRVMLPPPAVVEPSGGSEAFTTIPVTVFAPSEDFYSNEPYAVTLRVSGAYFGDSRHFGDAANVTFLLTVKGFSAPAPGAGAAVAGLAAVAVALAVVLGRRARR